MVEVADVFSTGQQFRASLAQAGVTASSMTHTAPLAQWAALYAVALAVFIGILRLAVARCRADARARRLSALTHSTEYRVTLANARVFRALEMLTTAVSVSALAYAHLVLAPADELTASHFAALLFGFNYAGAVMWATVAAFVASLEDTVRDYGGVLAIVTFAARALFIDAARALGLLSLPSFHVVVLLHNMYWLVQDVDPSVSIPATLAASALHAASHLMSAGGADQRPSMLATGGYLTLGCALPAALSLTLPSRSALCRLPPSLYGALVLGVHALLVAELLASNAPLVRALSAAAARGVPGGVAAQIAGALLTRQSGGSGAGGGDGGTYVPGLSFSISVSSVVAMLWMLVLFSWLAPLPESAPPSPTSSCSGSLYGQRPRSKYLAGLASSPLLTQVREWVHGLPDAKRAVLFGMVSVSVLQGIALANGVLRLSLHGMDAVEASMHTTALLILAGMLLEVAGVLVILLPWGASGDACQLRASGLRTLPPPEYAFSMRSMSQSMSQTGTGLSMSQSGTTWPEGSRLSGQLQPRSSAHKHTSGTSLGGHSAAASASASAGGGRRAGGGGEAGASGGGEAGAGGGGAHSRSAPSLVGTGGGGAAAAAKGGVLGGSPASASGSGAAARGTPGRTLTAARLNQ
ncbi:hypothetical protein FOA52_002385 [Chlamydomonas sp. UWO 241]|nr:hypothetical protein FOA52_002385 [Chlamydomonas sp. UWO 241]